MQFLCCRNHESSKGKRFIDTYDVGRKLGQGAFSVVKCVTPKSDPEKIYAAKIINKKNLQREDLRGLKNEIRILQDLGKDIMPHPHILLLVKIFDEVNHLYLVTELLSGGELYDQIFIENGEYLEKDVRYICQILFDAMNYCHERGIAHRDLKPQNILLMNRMDNRKIKIADFGFAAKAKTDTSLRTQCGTPDHVAPEILEGKRYGTKVDVWSLGVITYTLLVGYLPFKARSQYDLFCSIKTGTYDFSTRFWNRISDEGKSFVRSLLTVNPGERNSTKGALNHEWMKMSDGALSSQDLFENLLNFKKFNAKRKIRQSVFTLIAANKITNLIVNKESKLKK